MLFMALRDPIPQQPSEPALQRGLATIFLPEDQVLPGVRFGRPDELLTPAYWVMRCANAGEHDWDFVSKGGSLEEEVGFCLLGGYGVTVEVACAFFERLRKNGVFQPSARFGETEILHMLLKPADVQGRQVRYRFPQQRARRLHLAMHDLSTMELSFEDAKIFRNQIQSLEGVGPKTASWIARNWLGSDCVAILDIHVLRAGWIIGLFKRDYHLPKDYFALEDIFLRFSKEINVRASVLDAVIWSDMRKYGSRLYRERLCREAKSVAA